MHKEHMSKITSLGVKHYKFYERLTFPTTGYIMFKRHFWILTGTRVRKICRENVEIGS